MSRGSNFEKFLNEELEACILDLPLPDHPDGKGHEFKDPRWDHPGDELGGSGSNNWAGVALGCRYSTMFHERRFNAAAAATRYLTISKTKFLGSEVDSSVYTWMVANAVMEIAAKSKQRGDGPNRLLAMNWLRYLAARNYLFWDHKSGRILHVGERSGAHPKPGVDTWQDSFLKTLMGWGQPPKYERALVRMRPLLLEVGEELRSGRSAMDILRELGYRTMIPVRVAEWESGKAVWLPGKSINGNTQAVKAAVRQDGLGTLWAPRNRGYINDRDRTHRAPGRSEVSEVTDPHGNCALDYTCPVYASIFLPIAARESRTLDISIGGDHVLEDLRVGVPEVPQSPGTTNPPPNVPTAPNRPKRKSWWRRLLGL